MYHSFLQSLADSQWKVRKNLCWAKLTEMLQAAVARCQIRQSEECGAGRGKSCHKKLMLSSYLHMHIQTGKNYLCIMKCCWLGRSHAKNLNLLLLLKVIGEISWSALGKNKHPHSPRPVESEACLTFNNNVITKTLTDNDVLNQVITAWMLIVLISSPFVLEELWEYPGYICT